MIPTLQSDRLLLRAFDESDVPPLAAMNADPDFTQFLGDGRTLSREETWRQVAFLLGHWRLRGYGMWAVERVSTGEVIGRVGFLNPLGWPGFELGWAIGKQFQGNGYATEAARLALRYAFVELRQRRVISLIHPENGPSIRVAERLGEHPVGTVELAGRDIVVYAIDRSEYDG